MRVDDLYEFLASDLDLPPELDDVSTYAKSSRLYVAGRSEDIPRYTPIAEFAGTVAERHVVVEEGEATHKTPHAAQADADGWDDITEEDDFKAVPVDYITFNNMGNKNLMRHSALRAEMFDVLCQLTSIAHKGHVHGILTDGESLTPVRYDAGGEQVPVDVSVVDDGDEEEADGTDTTSSDTTPHENDDNVGPQVWTSY